MDGESLSQQQRAQALEAVRASGCNRVKLAVCDIDGLLRGKVIHADRFPSVLDGGFGFNVFGCDVNDRPYDEDHLSGRGVGFPDANVRLDPSTLRTVPWDDNVPFFLGEFVKANGTPHPLCPRQILKRVLKRAGSMGLTVVIGSEYEFFNFKETTETWASKRGKDPTPITHGMLGYSLLEATAHRDYFTALMELTARFRVPLDSLHTETGPGVYEAAILYGPALEAGDRAVLFKHAAKEIGTIHGIMPSFMAKWHHRLPGCGGHVHQSLSDGARNVFFDPAGPHGGMSATLQSYLAGQLAFLMEFAPMFWPTVNSYKRLVEGAWAPVRATWGLDNRTAAFRVLSGSPTATRLETRFPGADVNPYLSIAAVVAAGLEGVAQELPLATPPVQGDNGGGEGAARAPRTLVETTRIFHASRLAREWFGADFVDYFAGTREQEWRQYLDAVTDWERRRYFEVI